MQTIQGLGENRRRNTSYDWDPTSITTIPALGQTCQNVTAHGIDDVDNCMFVYQHGIPLGIDMEIPRVLSTAESLTMSMYERLMAKAGELVNAAIRAQAAVTSCLGLLPITLAILPGLAKGAAKVKSIIPQSALVGYVLVLAPAAQLPLMATVLCVVVQLGGSWKIWGAVMLFTLAHISPILAGVNALGAHSSAYSFQSAHSWRVKMGRRGRSRSSGSNSSSDDDANDSGGGDDDDDDDDELVLPLSLVKTMLLVSSLALLIWSLSDIPAAIGRHL
jgi:hypothetical protein